MRLKAAPASCAILLLVFPTTADAAHRINMRKVQVLANHVTSRVRHRYESEGNDVTFSRAGNCYRTSRTRARCTLVFDFTDPSGFAQDCSGPLLFKKEYGSSRVVLTDSRLRCRAG